MMATRQVLIFGATGNVGGAAARQMLTRGWQVRAVTRDPSSEKALALARLGAEVIQGDMEQRDSLAAAFDGMRNVFSVQNWVTSGIDGEVRQGKLVAEAAHAAGVDHLVYLSAGTGAAGTGIPHFDNKLVVEAAMRELGLPITVIRPAPFMELLAQKAFYPALGAWGAEPKVLGWDTPIPWVAVTDIGIAIANIFENPSTWLGRDVELFGDVKTLRQCQAVFVEVDGKKPFRVPLPLWLFRKMAGDEFIQMWQWMVEWIGENGAQALWETVEDSRAVVPGLLDMGSWLRSRRNGNGAMAPAV